MLKLKLMVLISLLTKFVITGSSNKNDILWDYKASPEDLRNNHIESIKLYMNTSVDPCYDFHEYSCGNWRNAHENFKTKTVLGVLNEKIEEALKGLIKDDDNNEQPLKLFYKSCMNTDLILERGNQPAIDFLKTFNGWPMVDSKTSNEYIDWFSLSAELAVHGKEYILRAEFHPEGKNANQDSDVISLTKAHPYMYFHPYENLKNQIKFIMGEDVSDDIMNEITAFSGSLRSTCRDRFENSSIITLEELLIEDPHIVWERYLSILMQKRVYSTQKVKVQVECLKELGELLSNTSPRIIANYMYYNLMVGMLYELVSVSTGYTRLETRDEYCVAFTQEYLGQSLSKIFLDKYLDESANDRAIELSEEIRLAFSEFIGQIFWIDEQTKDIAKEKLHSIKLNVGYKTEDFKNYLDYTDLKWDEFFENSIKLQRNAAKSYRYMSKDELNDITQFFANYDLQAFFMRNDNSTGDIYVTAGMLQPPLFNNYIPNWSNYGGIGYIIGHEMAHGFNVRFLKARENETDSEWWSPESFKEYMMRTLCYNFQYDKYTLDEQETSVDGQKTLSENIADNGGLKFGYEAYQKWLNNHPESDENQINPLLNLTGEQLYFVSFAQTHCPAENKEEIQDRSKYDGHTTPMFRVIGSVTNSFDFARAFQCPIGSPMNPPRKCRF